MQCLPSSPKLRFSEILLYAIAVSIHARKCFLCLAVALTSCRLEPMKRGRKISLDSVAIRVQATKIILSLRNSLLCEWFPLGERSLEVTAVCRCASRFHICVCIAYDETESGERDSLHEDPFEQRKKKILSL